MTPTRHPDVDIPAARSICAVTTSRADYGHLHWPLQELKRRAGIDLRLIALGAHLSREFGYSMEEIAADGLHADETIECLLSSDTDTGMAKTLGIAVLGLADTLSRLRPDILLLIADRYEVLAPAAVALTLRIPVAHIEGGEVSEGAIDDAVRNAITKMSHLHFTPTTTATRRVMAMGEEAWRIHQVGAPSLDHLTKSSLPTRNELQSQLGIALPKDLLVVAYHPVTLLRDTLAESDALFGALDRVDQPIVFCFPNSDAGARRLIRETHAFCEQRSNATVFVNLNPIRYWSLLQCAVVLIGNSSSGIMETASLALPTVNVGIRQQGRERAANIIDVEPNSAAILAAITRAQSTEFRASLKDTINPYGDGRAAERIADTLSTVALDQRLLMKKALPLSPGTAAFEQDAG